MLRRNALTALPIDNRVFGDAGRLSERAYPAQPFDDLCRVHTGIIVANCHQVKRINANGGMPIIGGLWRYV